MTGMSRRDALRVSCRVQNGYTPPVNGGVQPLIPVAGAYVTLSRTWAAGDTVTISMPRHREPILTGRGAGGPAP